MQAKRSERTNFSAAGKRAEKRNFDKTKQHCNQDVTWERRLLRHFKTISESRREK